MTHSFLPCSPSLLRHLPSSGATAFVPLHTFAAQQLNWHVLCGHCLTSAMWKTRIPPELQLLTETDTNASQDCKVGVVDWLLLAGS